MVPQSFFFVFFYISSFILYHLFYPTMPFAVLMGFQMQCLVHPKSLEQSLFSFCFKSEFVVIVGFFFLNPRAEIDTSVKVIVAVYCLGLVNRL